MPKGIVAGVAGAGVFGAFHARKYAALPGVRLGAVYDIDKKRASALAAAHGARPFTEIGSFLDAVDAVTVASPASSHFTVACEALRAGRHVLIEKPIALCVSHAERLIAVARGSGAVLQVGHQERFVLDAFGLFSRAARPRQITCVRRNPRTGRGEDVSVVFDLMIHDIDLVRRLGLGEPVATAAFGGENEVDARMTFADGSLVNFEASRLSPTRERRMTVVYDDGAIEIDFVKRTIANSTPEPIVAAFDDSGDPSLVDPLGHGVARFIAAVRGEGPPAITAEEGRDAVAWALLIENAAIAHRADAPRLRVGA